MTDTIRYLRHRKDGTIYEWHPVLAENPICEEVSEEEAFPERFIPKAQKGRKPHVNVTTDTNVVDALDAQLNAPVTNPELDAELTRKTKV